jgi:hypothetical protein
MMLEISLAIIKRRQIYLSNQMLQFRLKVVLNLTTQRGHTRLSKALHMILKDV